MRFDQSVRLVVMERATVADDELGSIELPITDIAGATDLNFATGKEHRHLGGISHQAGRCAYSTPLHSQSLQLSIGGDHMFLPPQICTKLA